MNGLTKAGIVTLANWTMCPDGHTYLYIWCPAWRVTTDADLGEEIGVDKLRSSERWQLIGVGVGGEIRIVIPGCQVKAFVPCERVHVPGNSSPGIYRFA